MLYNQSTEPLHKYYYAMFARSHDVNCNVPNKIINIHLIASVYQSYTELNLNNIKKLLYYFWFQRKLLFFSKSVKIKVYINILF